MYLLQPLSAGEYVFVQDFSTIGGPYNFTVSEGVTSIFAIVCGAAGGTAWGQGGNATGGDGGCMSTILAVTPSESLSVYVGGVGGNVNADAHNGSYVPGGVNGGGRHIVEIVLKMTV